MVASPAGAGHPERVPDAGGTSLSNKRPDAGEAMGWSPIFSAAAIGEAISVSPQVLVLVLDADGRIQHFNAACEAVSGYPADKVARWVVWDILTCPLDRAAAHGLLGPQSGRVTDGPLAFETRWRCLGGVERTIAWSDVGVTGPDGRRGVVRTGVDVTEQRRLAEALRRGEATLQQILDIVPGHVEATDTSGRIVFANAAAAEYRGCPQAEIVGAKLTDILVDDLTKEREAGWAEAVLLHGERVDAHEVHTLDGGGRARVLDITKLPFDLPGGRGPGVLSLAVDVTEHKRVEATLRAQAYRDTLTLLPNRALFVARLEHAIERGRRRDAPAFALLFMDLDGFKDVNDTLGHPVGDRLLIEFAKRLRAGVRPGDTVARFGGDEFAVLLEPVGDVADALLVAERVHEVCRDPVRLGGAPYYPSCSIGATLHQSPDGRGSAELLRDADAAMYAAKRTGRGETRVFSEAMRREARYVLEMRSELRQGMDASQFHLAYQPIVRLADAAVIGAEALLRWDHPERGLLHPEAFLGVAEDTGDIKLLDSWVVWAACKQLAAWRAAKLVNGGFQLSINVCADRLIEPRFSDYLTGVARTYELDPAALRVELTETTLVRASAAVRQTLQALRANGVGVALDDFGTGFSSLSHVCDFPLDTIKIDRAFTSAIGEDDSRTKIVDVTVGLGRALGFGVTAEGIETQAQLDFLRSIGCDYGQGYLFGHPMSPEAFAEVMVAARA